MVKVQTRYIDITPHRSILTKIAQTGYSIQEALAELIDNAIDARIPGEKLAVDINISGNGIVISDNGKGMTEEQAVRSIRLGYSDKVGKLGEFGLGLKTATSFLGKSFELATTPKNCGQEYLIKYNEDEWLSDGDWFRFPFTIKEGVNTGKSGTVITIKGLKIEPTDRVLKNIQNEFGLRFGPFIQNGELELRFNNRLCQPFEPQIIGGRKDRFKFVFKGGKAWGWWGYQLSGLNKSYYGFHTFRRGRLVTTFDKIGLTPNQDIKQIIGQLHIEGIPITHDKKGWLKSSAQYLDLESRLREYLQPFEKKPKRILSGYPASAGKVVGTVRVVNMFMSANLDKEMARIKKGDIIVTHMTRPHFLLGIRRCSGIVTNLGGSLCHAAIVAREFDIPAVVGTQMATEVLKDGQQIILDGNEGYVYED